MPHTSVEHGNSPPPAPPTAPPPVDPAGVEPFAVLYDIPPTPDFQLGTRRAQKVLMIYQSDSDPSSMTDGVVAPAVVIAYIHALLADDPPPPWGCLDFETPFDDIFGVGTSHAEYQPAIDTLVALIQAVKLEFPTVKWTFYGFPRLAYRVGGKDWGALSESTKAATKTAAGVIYGPLLAECQWVMPSLYDKQQRTMYMPAPTTDPLAAEVVYRAALVEAPLEYYASQGMTVPPVIPIINPLFLGSVATCVPYSLIPAAEFDVEQVDSVVDAGAYGLCVWADMRTFLAIATKVPVSPGYEEQAAEIRAAWAPGVLGVPDPADVVWDSPATKAALGSWLNAQINAALAVAYAALRSAQGAVAVGGDDAEGAPAPAVG